MEEGMIVGRETSEEALNAVQAIFTKIPELKKMMDEKTVPWPPTQLHKVIWCSKCVTGQMHTVGRWKLPGGRLGMGGLVICDSCGHYTGQR